jgi:hypothetical protein
MSSTSIAHNSQVYPKRPLLGEEYLAPFFDTRSAAFYAVCVALFAVGVFLADFYIPLVTLLDSRLTMSVSPAIYSWPSITGHAVKYSLDNSRSAEWKSAPIASLGNGCGEYKPHLKMLVEGLNLCAIFRMR